MRVGDADMLRILETIATEAAAAGDGDYARTVAAMRAGVAALAPERQRLMMDTIALLGCPNMAGADPVAAVDLAKKPVA